MTQETIKQLQQYLGMMKTSGVDFIPKASVIAESETSPTIENQFLAKNVKGILLELRDTAVQCKKCTELATIRRSVVFGSGNARATLVFVGEAPGYDEDIQGLPFVGKAGQL